MNHGKPEIEAVRKSVELSCSAAEAFRIFVEDIDSWWPLSTHSIGEREAVTCFFEGKDGGRVYETHKDGSLHMWGTVTAWEPPNRVVFTWHPGRDESTAQEVELRFSKRSDHTLVELEHRGWEVLGERAAEIRDGYETGWSGVLAAFVARSQGADSA